MDISLDSFFLYEKQVSINNWIESFNDNTLKKILVIYGNNGVGKNKLAHTILNNYTIIYYNQSIDIEDILNKLDISCMFSKKKYKSIIFDNVEGKNKPIIDQIISIIKCKEKYIHNPIIIIMNTNDYYNIKRKVFKDNILPIELKYTDKEWIQILQLYKNKYNCKIDNDSKFINKCNYNINNIINNLQINNNTNNIPKYDTEKKFVDKQVNNLLYNYNDYSDLFIDYYNNNNIICLNILDNIFSIVKDNNEYLNKTKIKTICSLYNTYLHYDSNRLYNNHEILLIYSILSPYIILKNKTIQINIDYNKYISNSILYISINNIINNHKYIYDIHNNYYKLIKLYFNSEKEFIKSIQNDDINIKLLKYYYKLYYFIHKNLKSNFIQFNKVIKNAITQ